MKNIKHNNMHICQVMSVVTWQSQGVFSDFFLPGTLHLRRSMALRSVT